MAQRGSEREILNCSICLELLNEPVTIPCGHNFCKTCISSFWNGANNIYSCPQCRKTFTSKPVLVKNTMLANLVEDLKSRRDVPPSTAAEDVTCDFCTTRKRKASKSCLNCMASYCENHLQPHHELIPLKRHKLVDPSKKLQDKICSRHDEVKKMFCRTDQQLICILCSMEEHKDHDMVSAAAEKTEKQKELQENRANVQKNIQDRKKDVDLLKHQMKTMNDSAVQAVAKNDLIFTELTKLLNQRSSELKKKVLSKKQTKVSVLQGLQEKLEQEISELKKIDTELEKISTTDDHVQFILSYNKLSALSVSTHSSIIFRPPENSFKEVTAAVSELRENIQKVLMEDWTKICHTVEEVEVLPTPMTREELLKYSKRIILDPNTANRRLQLSEENKKVTFIKECQSYPDHPDRFTYWCQVLSRESLTGRCYWEVEWRGLIVDLVVAYKSISRAGIGNDCRFGNNEKSWSLRCYPDRYSFYHNSIYTSVSGPHSSRIGMYVDHTAGILSFYSVSETMTLLHRVKTTFTEPLHAGVYIYYDGDSVQFGKPYMISI